MDSKTTVEQTVTAIAAGTLANGSPNTRRVTYLLDREPEHNFIGTDKSRLFYRVKADSRLGREYDVHVVVVDTASITAVAS